MPDTGSNWISEVRWDERGRPYRVYLMSGPNYKAGDRSYVSPEEARTSNDPKLQAWAAQNGRPGQSLFQNAGTWDSREGEWDRGVNWNNIATLGTGALTGVGIAGALTAPGVAVAGGGAASGGALPASSVPLGTAMTATPAAIGSQGASAGIGAGLGGVAPTTAALAGSGGNRLVEALQNNAPQLAALAAPALAGAITGSGGGDNQTPEELRRILAMVEARTRRADPLHQAAVQMAFGALPTYGRQGISLPKVDLP